MNLFLNLILNLILANFSFQRGNQRTNGTHNQQSVTDQQKLNKNNNHNNKYQFIDTDHHNYQNNQHTVKKILPPSGNFNWNQPHATAGVNTTDQQQLNNLPHQQILLVKTPNMQSISTSSSPFSSTSSLSASPPLPIETTKPNEPVTFNNHQNFNNNKYNNTNNFSIKPRQQQQQQQNQHNQHQYPQQRQFYHPNSNVLARQALGVSTNDVLPLNKPIVPLDKITKYEHSNTNSNNRNNSNASVKTTKAPLNIFNTNIYNLAPTSYTNSTLTVKSNQVVDDSLRKSLVNLVDKFLNENNKNEDQSIEYEESIMSECLGK